MPIPLKLYRCLGHGLKMCILFGYNPQKRFDHFVYKMHQVICPTKVNMRYRHLVYASPPTFYVDSFETLQMFRSWSENVHIVWIYSSDCFLPLLSQNEFSHFGQS